MLRKMSQELRYLTVALIGINRYQIANSRSIKKLMETGLSLEPKPLTKRLQVCTIHTPGLGLSSRGWIAKNPVINDYPVKTAYRGNKWIRKISYFICDRD